MWREKRFNDSVIIVKCLENNEKIYNKKIALILARLTRLHLSKQTTVAR